jgi:integrase/recombinase XerD
MEIESMDIITAESQAGSFAGEAQELRATTSSQELRATASSQELRATTSTQAEVIASVSLFAPPLSADTLADALVAGQLSPRTRRAYASDLAELLSVLDAWNVALTAVTRDHLNAYRAWLAGESVPGLEARTPCAPASVSRKVSVARQFFVEAESRGLIPVNPATRLRGFQVSDESKTLGLSRQQARELLEKIETATLLGLRDKAMLSLMIRTGLRRMDVISATIGALGEQQGHRTLRVLSKGNKDRLIKIPPEVSRHLDAWRAGAKAVRQETEKTPLFCGLVKSGRGKEACYIMYRDGQRPLAEKAVWKIVIRRVIAAGIAENITPHSTRHTFITLALDAGAPLHKVQVAAGHADPRTTERYWRTKQNLDDNAVDYVRL